MEVIDKALDIVDDIGDVCDVIEDISGNVSNIKNKVSDANRKKHIEGEYDSLFDGEDKLSHKLVKIKSKIDLRMETVDVEDIIIPEMKKKGREDTLTGLNGLVSEWGVVQPIQVLALEDEGCYMLLEGLRRIFASTRNNQTKLQAIIWDFSDKEEGKELANIISLMLNRSQIFTPKEQWNQLKILEENNNASPGLIEFLLQMQSGDSMKLKDVMLADAEYIEVKDKLLGGELTIDGAYKKLCNMRKKEDKLSKEDKVQIEETDYHDINSEPKLSVDDVKGLLDLTEEDITDQSLEDLNKTDEIRGNVVQDTQHRHPVDFAVKQKTLMRDEFKCRCCGIGSQKTGVWLNILVYHHLIPVYCGGGDTVENGLTLCANCHITLHDYLFGKVQINLDELTDAERVIYKNIFKYGNIALEAQKRAGLNKEKAGKLDAPSRKHIMPGKLIKDNREAFDSAKKEE